MCGICGEVRPAGAPADRDRVRRMRDALVHRGPDDAGEFFASGVGLGFRRLSILDLSPAGHQPMGNEDGSVQLIFNGEIYNFPELRATLEARGHRFRSKTDSECILHGYEEYGADIVPRLHGMFAFAVWDGRRRRLLLARDRFGKKPLFYRTEPPGALRFASELAPLATAGEGSDLDLEALALYLRFQFIPSPHTIYRRIRRLPPAHWLLWEDGRVTLERYWSLDFTHKNNAGPEDAGAEVERILRDAIRRRLVSDVPLGLFLSGGLDSSILTALATDLSPSRVRTFSVGFKELSHNELPLARLVTKRYGTEHHEFVVAPNLVDVLPKLLRHYGEPFADSSAVAMYYVARETRQHVTVALSGDGGDENFAGYAKYPLLQALTRLDRIPLTLRRLGGGFARSLAGFFPASLSGKFRTGGSLLSGDLVSRYLDLFAVFDLSGLNQILGPDVRSAAGDPDSFARERVSDLAANASTVQRITALDLRLYLPEGLMTKTDIATMSNSLEARAPFLDHRLVEFTANLPDDLKRRNGQGKWLLRQQFKHLVPPELLTAPKHGFDLPVDRWLGGPLRHVLTERLRDPGLRRVPYLHWPTVDRLLDEQARGRAYHGIRLWALLCFAVWWQEARP